MVIFEIFETQNLSQIYSKTHQIASFFKKFRGSCPRTPWQSAWLCHAQHVASRHANF